MKASATQVRKRVAAMVLVAALAGSFVAGASVSVASAAEGSGDKVISH
jgi:hypothetical protein